METNYGLIAEGGLNGRDLSINESEYRRKIIAVGGAKGGVGKSIFATNLAVLLSSKGFRTVIADLDLGGANVHLYLGKRSLLNQSINDFLQKRVNTLDEIVVESDYGPYIIGGNSAELGTNSIEFGKKLRLLKAVGDIKADYIILDLGGDMSLNSLDFFLRADYGVVITTPESASYMSAYQFIKEALYRKLRRMFGPESRLKNERDAGLEQLIREITMLLNVMEADTIEKIVEKIGEQRPDSLPLIRKVLSDVRPCIVMNKVPLWSNVYHVPMMIQDVARKRLSKEVAYLGEISAQPEVEQSVLDQVPVIARYPHGGFAMEMERIANRLVCESPVS